MHNNPSKLFNEGNEQVQNVLRQAIFLAAVATHPRSPCETKYRTAPSHVPASATETSAAVSVRRRASPSDTGKNPFSNARAISPAEKSPSGPTNIVKGRLPAARNTSRKSLRGPSPQCATARRDAPNATSAIDDSIALTPITNSWKAIMG